jgi:hypothetical protein
MTMVRARLAISLAAVLLVGGLAGSARSGTAAPTNLHGFLLRADEPASTSFPRTPAFAWSPVAGALHYEFQLSLSDVFRDNSVVWAADDVSAPVLAPNITLPWITGNPHSLYARVRAVTATGASPWSRSYGFDLAPPAAPTPLPTYPGLLRWTPTDGATGYQVWLLDANKMEVVTTNVLDEREAYTFHETPQWTGTIHWRIRVLRPDVTTNGPRLNAIPAVQYGPWSPVYTTTNPNFATGQLQLVGTVSDAFSDGTDASPAHKLMPALVFSGNTSLSGQQAELFRVEVFTDKECLNRVFTGPVTGAPAYAPRPFGPLAMPTSNAEIATARTSYLTDGSEPAGVALDGDKLNTTESLPDASPTGSPPPAPGETSGSTRPSSSSGSPSPAPAPAPSPSPSSSPPPASAPIGGTVSWSGRTGAPVDLWDVDWPNAGYYWTVVPVSATPQDAITTAVVGAGAQKGDKDVPVANTQGFSAGDVIQIGAGPTAETVTLTGVSRSQLTLASALANAHPVGETVTRTSGVVVYRDLDLAQDACAAGRVQRFGKASEPSLTSSNEVFATGMSVDGRLTSARHTTAFYGQPLVSWTPALGANAYEVQWSKRKYPFKAEPFGAGNGYVTTGTSLVLPVAPGTWYYRVRGFDYSLPTGSQQMSWSGAAKLVVAKPRFKIVGGGSAPKAKAGPTPKSSSGPSAGYKVVKGPGYSMQLPTGWKSLLAGGFEYTDALKKATAVATISQTERAGRTYAAWADALATQLKADGAGPVSTAVVQLAAGKGIRLTTTFTNKGATKSVLEYVVDKSNIEYIVAFSASQQNYAKYLPTFGHAISTFKLG